MKLVLGDEHAARLGALVAGDDPTPLEHVDQATGARVAHAQAPLDQGHRGRLRHDDDLDRLVEQRILVGVELAVLVRLLVGRLGSLEQRLVEVLPALGAALLDDERDLFLAHVRTLQALET